MNMNPNALGLRPEPIRHKSNKVFRHITPQGRPLLCMDSAPGMVLNLGVDAAKAVLENLDAIRAFVAEN